MSNRASRQKREAAPEALLDALEQQAADELVAHIIAAERAKEAVQQQLLGMVQFALRRKGHDATDWMLSYPQGRALLTRKPALPKSVPNDQKR